MSIGPAIDRLSNARPAVRAVVPKEKSMQFMMMVKANANYEAGVPPKPELFAAIGKLTEEMTRAGAQTDIASGAGCASGDCGSLARTTTTAERESSHANREQRQRCRLGNRGRQETANLPARKLLRVNVEVGVARLHARDQVAEGG